MSKPSPKSDFVNTESKFWSVTPRTVRNWVKRGLPVSDRVQLARAILSQKNASDAARKIAEEVVESRGVEGDSENPGRTEPSPVSEAPDYDDFQKWLVDRKEEGRHDPLTSLETTRDYYTFKLEKATRENMFTQMKNYSDLVVKFEKAISDNRLAAQKLGLETGDTINKSEVLRLIRALAFWLMRCTDRTLHEICPNLVGLDFPEEVHPVLDAYLLDVRFLKPLTRATTKESGVSLPVWVVQTIRDQVNYYLEDGGQRFEEELKHAAP